VIPAERVAAAVHGHPVFANERFSDVSDVREVGRPLPIQLSSFANIW
jgi:hypothetical protein